MAKTGTGGEVLASVEDLPRSIVRRVVKDKLAQLDSYSSKKKKKLQQNGGGGGGGDGGGRNAEGDGDTMNLNKESLLAFSESARIFIHYLSATANDVCKESKRQTINAEDVLKALEEIEFPEFIGPLRASLEDYRKKNVSRKSASKGKEDNRKRKLEEGTKGAGDQTDVGDANDANEVNGNDSNN